ncbi:DUF1501 domain-containing protein [Lignipirellula cremea]|uniref:Sulfatase n=1 Tax=Lignipirellula cremea TaxID=2528010 RepID=A0A518DZY7_9BACT|nr:DUF1501 domain-containing protein [Lignipirellula cremea]QDU97398.1 hypothetical protein Pla8534_52440 [Lignipirellula cremea]
MFSRRQMLQTASAGFGALALAGLCAQESQAAKAASPLQPKAPHFEPKAKRVIFLCMRGAPAQCDTFDYKPRDRKGPIISTPAKGGKGKSSGPAGSITPFSQHGESGLWIADTLPHLAKHADDLCLINSMHTDLPNHPQSYLMMHTGDFRFARPSVGAWVLYGLGTENQNLPGFISINPETRVGGAQNYGSAFLPAIYQGTSIGNVGANMATAGIRNVAGSLPDTLQRRQLDMVQEMNQGLLERSGVDTQLEGVIESLELGFRMQTSATDVLDLTNESAETLERYNVGKTQKVGRCLDDDFGRQCLWARRLAEAGVRYIEVCHSNWDQHGNHATEVAGNCTAIDKPFAALLQDLKDRDMLKDTLIVWGGEFGRTPLSNPTGGSNHNSRGFTYVAAGGGIQGGQAYGKTDETGAVAIENKVHIHDLHATMLHLLGLDHEQLTYRYAGRDFRLTDVYGNVVHDLLA